MMKRTVQDQENDYLVVVMVVQEKKSGVAASHIMREMRGPTRGQEMMTGTGTEERVGSEIEIETEIETRMKVAREMVDIGIMKCHGKDTVVREVAMVFMIEREIETVEMMNTGRVVEQIGREMEGMIDMRMGTETELGMVSVMSIDKMISMKIEIGSRKKILARAEMTTGLEIKIEMEQGMEIETQIEVDTGVDTMIAIGIGIGIGKGILVQSEEVLPYVGP